MRTATRIEQGILIGVFAATFPSPVAETALPLRRLKLRLSEPSVFFATALSASYWPAIPRLKSAARCTVSVSLWTS